MMFFLQNEDTNSQVNATDNASVSYEPTKFDVAKEVAEIYKNPLSVLTQVLSKLTDALSPTEISKAVVNLDAKSAELIKVLGVGKARAAELTGTIAEAIPKYMRLGLDASQVTKDYKDVVNQLKQNVQLTDEQLVKLAATSKVTGIAAKDLVENFRSVGTPLDMIESKMMEVVKVSQETGVILGSVAAGLSTNLSKMNLFNFENGVRGLAQMSAQSARLGISMEKVFTKAEDFLDPEKAIEFSAALQRLGVTTSELLDPLRVMDLAQNDPTELQNQMVSITKEFVTLNEKNNQLEILPGAKRRMREVAQALGMTGEEFASMALKSADFDRKLSAVKFSPNIKEEDRELIATMSQISESGIAQVKITGDDGTEKMVDVASLTEDQIKQLKEQQKLEGKTMEELARDQLGQLEDINGAMSRFTSSLTLGVASSTKIQSGFREGTKKVVEGLDTTESVDVKYIRESTDTAIKTIGGLLEKLGTVLELPDLTTVFAGASTMLSDALKSIGFDINNVEFPSIESITLPESVTNIITEITGGGETSSNSASAAQTPKEITINHNVSFTAPDYVSTAQLQTMVKDTFTNPIFAQSIVKAADNVNSGII